mgnify:CR=1 FL=1
MPLALYDKPGYRAEQHDEVDHEQDGGHARQAGKSERQQRNARMAPKPMPTNWRVNDASAMVSDAAQITSEPYASRQSHATSTGTLTF